MAGSMPFGAEAFHVLDARTWDTQLRALEEPL
jgi:hypothetical protein